MTTEHFIAGKDAYLESSISRLLEAYGKMHRYHATEH